MVRRNWIKIYPEGFLRRTLFKELLPIERWVWIGFLCLAGDNALDGKICLTEDMGYTDEQLAKLLDTDINILKVSKKKMIKFEKISVDKNNVIQILSWNIYQSEYQRQRDYRKEYKKKLQREVTTQSNDVELPIDRDRDREEDIDKKKKKKDKHKYADYVFLTKKEYQKLIEKLGKSKTEDMIEKLNNYIGQIGIKKANQKYTSHYHTILNWIRREKENSAGAKTEGQDWEKIKEKRDDYKHTDRPEKITKEVYKILSKADPKYRDKLNKLKEE